MRELVTTSPITDAYGTNAPEFVQLYKSTDNLTAVTSTPGVAVKILRRFISYRETLGITGFINPLEFATMINCKLSGNNTWTKRPTKDTETPPCSESDANGDYVRFIPEFDIRLLWDKLIKQKPLPEPCANCTFECPLKGVTSAMGLLGDELAYDVNVDFATIKTTHPYLRRDNFISKDQAPQLLETETPERLIPKPTYELIRNLNALDPESEISIAQEGFKMMHGVSWIGSIVRAIKDGRIDIGDATFLLESVFRKTEIEAMAWMDFDRFILCNGSKQLTNYLVTAREVDFEEFKSRFSDLGINAERIFSLMKTIDTYSLVSVPEEVIPKVGEEYLKSDSKLPPYFVTKSTSAVFDACRQAPDSTFTKIVQAGIKKFGGNKFYNSSLTNEKPSQRTLRSYITKMACVMTERAIKWKNITLLFDPIETITSNPSLMDNDNITPQSPREVAENLYPEECGFCELSSNCFQLRKAQTDIMRKQILKYCKNLEANYYRYWLLRELWRAKDSE